MVRPIFQSHLDALALKVEMALDHHSHLWLLQVLQKST